jgi:hypothetical protein
MPILVSLSQILSIINNYVVVIQCEPLLAKQPKMSFVEF